MLGPRHNMRAVLLLCAVLCAISAVAPTRAAGVTGVDVAVWDDYSLSQWQCFAKAGYSFAVRILC